MLRFPDEDGMIAGFDDGSSPAFERRQTPAQQRRAAFARRPVQAFKPALGLFRERNRNRALRFTEDIHRKVRALPKM